MNGQRLKPARQKSLIRTLRICARAGAPTFGQLVAGGVAVTCRLGSGGIGRMKREGDGRTPAGRFRMLGLLFRPDKGALPPAHIPRRPLRPRDSWCDAPESGDYNRFASQPFKASHERLWRADAMYDRLIVLDYNMTPRVKGRGSAIFFHLTAEPSRPTAGCVAVSADVMRRLLPRLSARSIMIIGR